MTLGRSRKGLVTAGAVALLVAPGAPAHAYHCYSEIVGDCSRVQHMLEDYEPKLCLLLEKATLGTYDCQQ